MVATENEFGRIIYSNTSLTTNSSIDFENEINISNNSIVVGSVSDLNTSAQLTFYNVNSLGLQVPTPLLDGAFCDTSVCTIVQNADTYIFNVSHFTNYSIGEGAPNTLSVLINFAKYFSKSLT